MKTLVLILCLSFTARAENGVRKSYIGTTFGAGDFKYSYLGVSGGAGLNETWRITASGTAYQSETDGSSRDARVGADAILNEEFTIRFGAHTRNEPNDIRGPGVQGGFDWTLSEFWHSDLQSNLFCDLEYTRYQQFKGTLGRIPDGEDLRQRSILIGFSQELTREFILSLTVTAFGYDGKNPDLWAQEAASARTTPDGGVGYIKGFQQSSTSLQLQWLTSDWLTTDMGVSTAKSTLGTSTKSASLGFNFLVKPHWSFDLNGSGSQTEGERDGGVLGTGIKYYF